MLRVFLIAALAAAVLPTAPAPAQAPEPVPTLVERAGSNVQAACRRADGPCPHPDVAAFERSATHRALAFQYRLGSAIPLRDAPWVGTHNSYNTATEPVTLSGSDHNQQVSMVDQLRMGVRSLELDLHFVRGTVMVCHGRPGAEMHAGCTDERPLEARLPEIRTWLDANRDQVLLVFLEDHLGPDGHAAAARIIDEQLGGRVLEPAGDGCRALPLDLTRDRVRESGRQVVLVSGCGEGAAWQGRVFDWSDHLETRPRGYDPGCGPDYTRDQYDATLVRYFEDSTVFTATTAQAGRAQTDDGLTPETTAAMVRCGVDLFGFDQLLPTDGRLAALVWSWAPHPRKCALHEDDGSWSPARCRTRRPFACHTERGWLITKAAGLQRRGRSVCRRGGGRFVLPRTGRQNALLAAAPRRVRPWLAYDPPELRRKRG